MDNKNNNSSLVDEKIYTLEDELEKLKKSVASGQKKTAGTLILLFLVLAAAVVIFKINQGTKSEFLKINSSVEKKIANTIDKSDRNIKEIVEVLTIIENAKTLREKIRGAVEKSGNMKDFSEKEITEISGYIDSVNEQLKGNRIARDIYEKSNTDVDYYAESLFHFADKNYEKALERMMKADSMKPGDVDIMKNLGRIYFVKSSYKKSLEENEKVLKLDPNDKVAWNNKAISLLALIKKGEKIDYMKALEAVDQSIKIDRQLAIAWYNKACIYSLMKKPYEAFFNLEVALRLSPGIKTFAEKDPDFSFLRQKSSSRFMKIIGSGKKK